GRPDDLEQPAGPRDRRVRDVADQTQRTAGAQHPSELRQRLWVEPVERLTDDDHVHRGIRERQRLRVRSYARNAERVGELRDHLRRRLYGDDTVTELVHSVRELSGAGA